MVTIKKEMDDINLSIRRGKMVAPILELLSARDSLIACHGDCDAARRTFRWPRHSEFNFVIDGFFAAAAPNRGEHNVVTVVQSDGAADELIYGASFARSNAVASFQRDAWHPRVGAGLRPNECREEDFAEQFAEVAS
jgi:hypothetical protein